MALQIFFMLMLVKHIIFSQAAQVNFSLELTWQNGSPNGFTREMIFVNDIFPGPPLYLDEGDDVTVSTETSGSIQKLFWPEKIEVTNHLPFNTSIHFHGIEYDWLFKMNKLHWNTRLTWIGMWRQQNTPWSDGVSGLSQWAILPGARHVYKWKATQYGTYWYHSHDKSRIMDGLYGAIFIRWVRFL